MNPSRPKHAMKFNVPLGQIGQTGVVVPQRVMVEFNHELVNVKMEKKGTVRDLRQVSSNAIEDHVTVGQWCTGMIIKDLLTNGAVFKSLFRQMFFILSWLQWLHRCTSSSNAFCLEWRICSRTMFYHYSSADRGN